MKHEIKAGKVDTRTTIVHECPQCHLETRLRVDKEFSNEEQTKTSFQVFCFECKLTGFFLTEYMKPVKRPKKVKEV